MPAAPVVTQEGLVGRFGETFLIRLTDDDGLGVIDGRKVTAAITAVTGVVEGLLRGLYPLPLPEVPAELQGYAEDLVLEKLYAGKPERETPKDVVSRASAAMSWLRDVKKGLATLSIARLEAPKNPGETGGAFIKTNKKAGDRLFSDSVLDGYTGGQRG